jgi:hypothetical protein
MRVLRAILALAGGALAWQAVVMLSTLASRLVWPAYAKVEFERVFTLDMLLSRLAVGALATVAFGVAMGWILRGDMKLIRLVLLAWLVFSVVDHIIVWNDFPVWYHLVYLSYIIPFSLLGAKLIHERTKAEPQ